MSDNSENITSGYIEKSLSTDKSIDNLYRSVKDVFESNSQAWNDYIASDKLPSDKHALLVVGIADFAVMALELKKRLQNLDVSGVDPARIYEMTVMLLSKSVFRNDYTLAHYVSDQGAFLLESSDNWTRLLDKVKEQERDPQIDEEVLRTEVASATTLLAYCCAIQCIRKSNENNVDAGVYATGHPKVHELVGIPIAYFYKALAMVSDASAGSEVELRYGYELALAAFDRYTHQPGILNLVADYELKLSRLLSGLDEKTDFRHRGLSHVNEAINLDPDYPSYYKLRSEIFSDLSNYPRAISDLTIAVRLAKSNGDSANREKYEAALEGLMMFDSAMSQVRHVQSLGSQVQADLVDAALRMSVLESRVETSLGQVERQMLNTASKSDQAEKRISEFSEELKDSKREQLQYMAIIASVIAIIQSGLTVVSSAAETEVSWRFWLAVTGVNAVAIFAVLFGIDRIARRTRPGSS